MVLTSPWAYNFNCAPQSSQYLYTELLLQSSNPQISTKNMQSNVLMPHPNGLTDCKACITQIKQQRLPNVILFIRLAKITKC